MRRWPLRWHQQLCRDLLCRLVGHHWKCSWQRVRDEEPVWWTKNRSGNPFCEFVASWHYKCRRCRHRTTNDVFPSFRQEVWGMFRRAWDCLAIVSSCHSPWPRRKPGWGYSRAPWYIWLDALVVGWPLWAFTDIWHCTFVFRWRWPSGLGAPIAWLSDKHMWWLEHHTTHYVWIKPQDPNDPHEMGFWMEASEAKKMRESGEWRARWFVYGDVSFPLPGNEAAA